MALAEQAAVALLQRENKLRFAARTSRQRFARLRRLPLPGCGKLLANSLLAVALGEYGVSGRSVGRGTTDVSLTFVSLPTSLKLASTPSTGAAKHLRVVA